MITHPKIPICAIVYLQDGIMQAKFHRHELTGNVPFGYQAEYPFANGHQHLSDVALSATALTDLGHGAPVSKLLTDAPAEQAIIRQLHAWRQALTPEGHPTSYTRVAALANESGSHPKQGGVWTCGHVSSVLNNRHTARLLAADPVQTPAPAL